MKKLTDEELDKIAGQIAAKVIETDIGQRTELYLRVASKLENSSQYFTAKVFRAAAILDKGA